VGAEFEAFGCECAGGVHVWIFFCLGAVCGEPVPGDFYGNGFLFLENRGEGPVELWHCGGGCLVYGTFGGVGALIVLQGVAKKLP